jgi:hypothetical protein
MARLSIRSMMSDVASRHIQCGAIRHKVALFKGEEEARHREITYVRLGLISYQKIWQT